MKTNAALCLILMLVVATISSCSTKPGNAKRESNPSSAKPAETAAPDISSQPASPPVVNRSPENLLTELPCKIENKQGAFAVFPDNLMAGQQCFSLYTAAGQSQQRVPQFDIRSGGITFVIHGSSSVETGAYKITQWRSGENGPCFDDACATDIPADVKTIPDIANSGWTYTIVTPEKTIDMAVATDVFYGLVENGTGYLPVFK